MSWTDKTALETINQIRDYYEVTTFVETGTFKGINAVVQSKNFKNVITCESNTDYFIKAKERLKNFKNVKIVLDDSRLFLADFKRGYKKNKLTDVPIFYLDAHFYNANAKHRFIVLEELKALENFNNCVIIIHDFDNGMGHICYDGIHLDMNLLEKDLKNVNPKFRFYTNIPSKTVIHTEETLKEIGLNKDPDALDNIRYAWTSERLTKRGILYCLPTRINSKEFNLRLWN